MYLTLRFLIRGAPDAVVKANNINFYMCSINERSLISPQFIFINLKDYICVSHESITRVWWSFIKYSFH